MVNLYTTLKIKYFLITLATILVIFFCLNLLSNVFFPHAVLYILDLNALFQLFFENINIIILTFICLLFTFLITRSLYKKLIYLFSEETTVKDIFDESKGLWKNGDYDRVYDNLSYLYQTFQKDNITNEYTISTQSILLFQKSNLNNKELEKKAVYDLTINLLNACMKLDHYLNIIHLAYSFAHLSKLEEAKQQKASYHLISSTLFYYADPILHKSETELEQRIYSYYVKSFPHLRNQILEEELEVLNSGINRSSEHFKNKIIPYMNEFLKENAVA